MENDEGYKPGSGQIKRIAPLPMENPPANATQPGAEFYRRQTEALNEERNRASGARHQSEVPVATSDSKAPDLSPTGKKTLLRDMNKRYGGGD